MNLVASELAGKVMNAWILRPQYITCFCTYSRVQYCTVIVSYLRSSRTVCTVQYMVYGTRESALSLSKSGSFKRNMHLPICVKESLIDTALAEDGLSRSKSKRGPGEKAWMKGRPSSTRLLEHEVTGSRKQVTGHR